MPAAGFTNPVWTGASEPAPASQAAEARTATEAPAESTPDSSQVWEPLATAGRPSRWVRVRRVSVLGALGVVMAVGTVDVVQTGWGIVAGPPPVVAPAVSDQQLAGFASAAAVDYLSWDSSAAEQRQAALARYAAPGTTIDGWDGEGRLWADSPSVLDVQRDGARAVATVRVRVIPAAAKQAVPGQQDTRGDAGALAAAAPGPAAEQTSSARWLTLALPIGESGGRPVITARPALVGSAPQTVPAQRDSSSVGDPSLAKSTKPAIGRLMTAYASGDLSYARLAGTRFNGLDGAAQLGEVQQWQLAELPESASEDVIRHGTAEVTWRLPNGSALTSDYAIDVSKQDGRWYLAAIAPDTPAAKEN